MEIEQLLYQQDEFKKQRETPLFKSEKASLVLGFGSRPLLEEKDIYQQLKTLYPAADIVLCSTSGEIFEEKVLDDSVSAVAISFAKTETKTIRINIGDFTDSFVAGRHLYHQLQQEGLAYVLVLSDGGLVNGSELVRGIESLNNGRIPVTGGLAGDAANFNHTLVGCNENPAKGNIVAVGFYGSALQVAHSSLGGWDTFGLEKKVTRSVANKLYEIDHTSALEVYKRYLGKYADELPGSALLFPLSVRTDDNHSVVRTILTIDNEEQAMIFAGDIPEGSYVRFMKANFDRLVEASMQAALQTTKQTGSRHPKLGLLISCVGRKIILGSRIDEETEAVREIFGPDCFLTGFYSYGEISPLQPHVGCALHNQTMTITTFDETC